MKRRTVLGSVGSLLSVGALAYASRDPVDHVDVRFWLSERAATYDGVAETVDAYLATALDLEWWSLEVSFGGVVSVSTEHGAAVTTSGEWPSRVIAGSVGHGDVDPVADVNLLVTDGEMQTAPTGYGLPHVASVGGARHLAEASAPDRRSTPLPYTTPNRVAQVLVHEVGHALGLDHDHGVAYRRGDTVVATPMLSTYAWDPDYDGRSRCHSLASERAGDDRRLACAFSECARRELETYDGGLSL